MNRDDSRNVVWGAQKGDVHVGRPIATLAVDVYRFDWRACRKHFYVLLDTTESPAKWTQSTFCDRANRAVIRWVLCEGPPREAIAFLIASEWTMDPASWIGAIYRSMCDRIEKFTTAICNHLYIRSRDISAIFFVVRSRGSPWKLQK